MQGLTSKRTNKLKSPELIETFKNHDVVLLTETWTNSFSDLTVDNFEYFVLNRTNYKKNSKRASGGIIVYVRNKLVSKDTLVFKSCDDIICIKIPGACLSLQQDLFVCLCYVVPDVSSRQSFIDNNIFDRSTDHIISIYSNNDKFNLLLCGDFNARSSDLPDYVIDDNFSHLNILPSDYNVDYEMLRCSQDIGKTNNNGHLLLDLCKQTGLRIMNGRVSKDKNIGKFTYVGHAGSSLVDYVICSQELFDNIDHFEVLDPNIMSDHCMINFTFTFDKQNCSETQSNLSYANVDFKYVWNNDHKSEFVSNVSTDEFAFNLDNIAERITSSDDEMSLDTCINDLTNLFLDTSAPLFKKSIISNDENVVYPNQPWFNEECFTKKGIFHKMLNRYRNYPCAENRKLMVNARSSYKSCIRKCRFLYDKDETLKLLNARHDNAKLYWNMLKQKSGVVKSNITINNFESYFKAVNNPLDKFYSPDEDVLYFIERYEKNEFNVMFEELNCNFRNDEILLGLNQLKTGKSAGPDALLNEFLIHSKYVIAPTLLILFNKLFHTGYFPATWSEGYVIPLHKKGSINETDNYRGITLLNVIGKLFTRIINNRLSKWADTYNVYIEAQSGFRAKMGTVDNIFVLHGLINHMINHGKQLFCAFIDFTKAFDYVVRDNLWYKLIKLGIRGNILDIIRSIYNSVKSRVKYCNKLSDSYTCALGVRQGECLSPFLFAMYLNDLEDEYIFSNVNGIDIDMFKLFLILYADDIVIFANDSEELQLALNVLEKYCAKWRLTVNTNKTKIMIFRKGGQLPTNLQFKYNNNVLSIVNKFTYLGIVFTPGGSFRQAQCTLAGQALKAIFQMDKYLYKFTDVSVSHRLDLFDKLVSPILNYASEVWGFNQGDAIEKIHMQFCKRVLCVKKTTQNDFIYGELGRVSFKTIRCQNIIKYWLKLIRSDSNKYVSKIYHLLKNESETMPHKVNWCSLVRDLLNSLGFNDAWLMQSVGDETLFLISVKQRLNDNFIQNWHSRLEASSRAIFYNCISEFKFQPYLNHIDIKKYRIELTKLRVASHRLQIEAGRWTKPA